MIHIILFVLKILGWIVLVILGLLLLLSLTVLFAGFQYRGKAKCMGALDTLSVGLEFSWLFHLIKGRFFYENGNMKWRLRVAWKTFPSDRKTKDMHKTVAEPEFVKTKEKEEPNLKEKDVEKKDTEEKVHTEYKKTAEKTERYDAFKGKKQKKANKLEYTFRKICDTIKALKTKKEHVLDFIREEVHRSAFKKGVKELKRLGGFLKPDVLEADLKFGFSDPAVTGYTLGVLSMIYPFIGEHVQLEPDFENKILKGQAFVQGKIRGIYPVIFLWNMLWSKQVRQTIADIKNFRL
ncbi:DUF2953 domain-containing protein [Faecalicatena acetigenes]|uniref:DUF2953 domain-containing protein n=1 Tax=Faecalicatena acetigenes TaxID=2981790 RepID=A0ABT2T8Q2_9FIRM|nr:MULTISPECIES: DUF2953 domain-containing protein [Lachnospiraceae]MCU6746642.1 DUF2953 domain-containing protein [Faecalicatena acetigenes]RGT74479.1 DUF2953 domain-containing protein [Ruminococcus sp. AF18-22]SCH33868.1 Protein of uncharacterised function (DUF2953) [uncultured Clostridium sp.]